MVVAVVFVFVCIYTGLGMHQVDVERLPGCIKVAWMHPVDVERLPGCIKVACMHQGCLDASRLPACIQLMLKGCLAPDQVDAQRLPRERCEAEA